MTQESSTSAWHLQVNCKSFSWEKNKSTTAVRPCSASGERAALHALNSDPDYLFISFRPQNVSQQ